MSDEERMPEHIWAVVEKIGQEENLVALELEESREKFIPVFRTSEDAFTARLGFPKKHGAEYDVESMHLSDLSRSARENRMDIYFLDKDGKVLERLTPACDA
jgi:hypothetical protein